MKSQRKKIICMILLILLAAGGCGKKKVIQEKSSEVSAADNEASDWDGYTKLLKQYASVQKGEDKPIEYDFKCPEYKELLKKYQLKDIAGEGSEFEQTVKLVDTFAPRLVHKGDYCNQAEENALTLLQYSLDQLDHGINCRAKAKILEEMCLALGIYARRVHIYPYSSKDLDSHVVNEIYDTTQKKWIMVDMTTDGYFVDEKNTPLSLLEIRDHFITGEFVTFTQSNQSGDLKERFQKNIDNNTYFAKNLFYLSIEKCNGFGGPLTGNKTYHLIPENFDVKERELSDYQYGEKVLKKQGGEDSLIEYCKKQREEIEKKGYEMMSEGTMTKAPM